METIVLEYDGFESLHGFDEDLIWAIEQSDLPGEFQGILTITMEYKEHDKQ